MSKPISVLIIDDSPEDREMYQRMLKQDRERLYSVRETEMAEEGLDLCREEDFDILLLDFNLPDMTGLEFLKELAGIDRGPFAVVMLTGQGNESVAVEAMKFGAADYMVKGTASTESLRHAILNALDKNALKKAIQLKQAELERSNKELEQYARVVAHDLKTPLHAIVGYLDFFREKAEKKLAAEDLNLLDSAMSCTRRMDNLIKELLAYSRIEGGHLRKEQLPLSRALDLALENLSADIQLRNAKINRPERMPTIQGNPGQITQIFQNLIGNALKFCRESQPEVTVTVEEGGGAEHLIKVSDNGIGIPDKDRDRVFAPFERLVNRSEFPGTGLGLAICKKIVERHGGVIWVEAAQPTGSSFCFTLPREPATP